MRSLWIPAAISGLLLVRLAGGWYVRWATQRDQEERQRIYNRLYEKARSYN